MEPTVSADGWPSCRNCNRRRGTEIWVGEAGPLAYMHGGGQFWCKVCVCEAQLAYAKRMAQSIPMLEAELVRLRQQYP